MEGLVADKVNSAVRSCQNELLSGIQTLITSEVQKISDSQKVFSELQLSKIAAITSSDYKFKRKSNEEQYKVNNKVLDKIQDCDRNIDTSELSQAKENLAEGKLYFQINECYCFYYQRKYASLFYRTTGLEMSHRYLVKITQDWEHCLQNNLNNVVRGVKPHAFFLLQ